MTHLTRNISLFVALCASLLLASGCIVTVDDELLEGGVQVQVEGSALASIEVNWTIDHSEASSLCAVYGIERWTVTLYGPETRETVVDCRAHYWSTESDLLYLPRGDYRVTVTALDDYDMIVGSVSSSLVLHGTGVQRLDIDFDGASF